jgi:thymidylate kinase
MSGKIRTIAFEGLDSSGKGTTIEKLAEIIQCECWATKKNMPEEDALRKKNIKEFGESRKLLDFLIKSYREESFRIKSLMEKNPDTVILLDRCFVTPAAIRYATRNDVSNWNPDWFERICENWEDGVLKPDLIFTIRVDEKLRAKRMRERAEEKGEEINEREKRLLSDDDYREDTLDAELKLGCIPLRIREKDPEVVALRALQMLLGDKRYEHRRRD